MKSLCVSYPTISFCFSFLFQTEIAKRLNAILAQIMPFLSQEVSFECDLQSSVTVYFCIKPLIVACILEIVLRKKIKLSCLSDCVYVGGRSLALTL